jgi:hypothetical protein
MWLLQPFTRSSDWNNATALRRIARDRSRSQMVRRQAMLAVGEQGERGALLDLKKLIGEATDWERRAIMSACGQLPVSERDAFYSGFGSGSPWSVANLVEKAVMIHGRRERDDDNEGAQEWEEESRGSSGLSGAWGEFASGEDAQDGRLGVQPR